MTVWRQREANKHLKDGIAESKFVKMRRERDATLNEPRLLHPSLQMNVRAGRLPIPTPAGDRMLQIPVRVEGAW